MSKTMTRRPVRLPSQIDSVVESVGDGKALSPVLEALRNEVLFKRQSAQQVLGVTGEVEDSEIDFTRDPLHFLAVIGGEAQDIDGNLIARADIKFDPHTLSIRNSSMLGQVRRNIARTADMERAVGIKQNRFAVPRASSSHVG